jgi:NTE family protein
MNFFKWLFSLRPKKKEKKITLGLALGSGGAKGFAELGALKAFEENGIEFNVVAGTSIGSIVGAFYANGYSSTDIYEMLERVDFSEIKNLFMIKMDTSGLSVEKMMS